MLYFSWYGKICGNTYVKDHESSALVCCNQDCGSGWGSSGSEPREKLDPTIKKIKIRIKLTKKTGLGFNLIKSTLILYQWILGKKFNFRGILDLCAQTKIGTGFDQNTQIHDPGCNASAAGQNCNFAKIAQIFPSKIRESSGEKCAKKSRCEREMCGGKSFNLRARPSCHFAYFSSVYRHIANCDSLRNYSFRNWRLTWKGTERWPRPA